MLLGVLRHLQAQLQCSGSWFTYYYGLLVGVFIRAVCPGMQHAAGALNSMCTAGRVGHPDSRHRPHRRPCAGVAGDVAWDQSPPAKDKQIDK